MTAGRLKIWNELAGDWVYPPGGSGGSQPPVTFTGTDPDTDVLTINQPEGPASPGINYGLRVNGPPTQDPTQDIAYFGTEDETGFTRVNYDGGLQVAPTPSSALSLEVRSGAGGDVVLGVGNGFNGGDADVVLKPTAADHVVLRLLRQTAQTASIIAYDGDGTWYLNPDGSVTMFEQTEPPAPPSNGATIFCKDSGGGKTQLCVRFASGASQVIATEP